VDANGAPIAGNVAIAQGGNARLRINLTNSGTAPATNVVLNDVLASVNGQSVTVENPGYAISGALPTNATANTRDGFSVTPLTLAPGETRSFIFNVTGTADGTYCDVASFTSDGGQNGNAQACLVVQTARLAITKTNTPNTSLTPGSNYASTITVSNTGSADALNVAVSDLIGANGAQFVTFGSGNFSVVNAAGANVVANGTVALSGNTVTTTPATVTIPAGGRLVFNITSSIPTGAPAGDYCDTATFTSTNSVPLTSSANACVNAVAFAGLQTSMVDRQDPVRLGSDFQMFTLLSNEQGSNEILNGNKVVFAFGLPSGNSTDVPGVFVVKGVKVYYDPTPTRNNEGIIISDQTHASTVLLTVNTDYTVDAATPTGRQILTFNRDLPIGAVYYVEHNLNVPTNVAAIQYQSNLAWQPIGRTSNRTYTGYASQATTILP